jgi:hypothetical protein
MQHCGIGSIESDIKSRGLVQRYRPRSYGESRPLVPQRSIVTQSPHCNSAKKGKVRDAMCNKRRARRHVITALIVIDVREREAAEVAGRMNRERTKFTSDVSFARTIAESM